MNKLFRSVVLTGAALVAVATVSAPSFAQGGDTMKVDKPFRVKLGAFFPADGDTKDIIGKTFLSAGVSYDFGKTKATSPIVYGAYVDYAGKKKTVSGVDVELTAVGVGAHARFLLAPATAPSGQPYVEAGLGYYSVKSKVSVDLGEGVTASASDTKGRFGGKLALGYQHVSGIFGEVEYTFISKIDDTDPSGFRALLGYRF